MKLLERISIHNALVLRRVRLRDGLIQGKSRISALSAKAHQQVYRYSVRSLVLSQVTLLVCAWQVPSGHILLAVLRGEPNHQID